MFRCRTVITLLPLVRLVSSSVAQIMPFHVQEIVHGREVLHGNKRTTAGKAVTCPDHALVKRQHICSVYADTCVNTIVRLWITYNCIVSLHRMEVTRLHSCMSIHHNSNVSVARTIRLRCTDSVCLLAVNVLVMRLLHKQSGIRP